MQLCSVSSEMKEWVQHVWNLQLQSWNPTTIWWVCRLLSLCISSPILSLWWRFHSRYVSFCHCFDFCAWKIKINPNPGIFQTRKFVLIFFSWFFYCSLSECRSWRVGKNLELQAVIKISKITVFEHIKVDVRENMVINMEKSCLICIIVIMAHL